MVRVRVRTFINDHGMMFRLVQVSDVVTVIGQGVGEMARWDSRAGFGMVKLVDGGLRRYTDHVLWADTVKSTAALMGVR